MPTLSDWLALKAQNSEKTAALYRTATKQFLWFHFPEEERPLFSVENLSDGDLNQLCSRYFQLFTSNEQHSLNYGSFALHLLQERFLARRFVLTMTAAVHAFLAFFRVEVEPAEIRRVRSIVPKIKGEKGQEREKVPTPKQLGELLSVMSLPARSFWTIAKASGARPSEILALQVGDIEWTDPATVHYNKTKSGSPRISFLDFEGVDQLKLWLEIRKNIASEGEARLWADFGMNEMSREWFKALRYCDMTERNTGLKQRRFVFRPYTTRKFFATYGIGTPDRPGIPEGILHALMGHSNYIRDTYSRYSQQQIAEFYGKGSQALICSINHPGVEQPEPPKPVQDAQIATEEIEEAAEF